MAAGKPVDLTAPAGRIERAVEGGDFASARLAMAVKLARMMDATDSARDAKAISLSLADLLDRCDGDAAKAKAVNGSPLAELMREAEMVLSDA